MSDALFYIEIHMCVILHHKQIRKVYVVSSLSCVTSDLCSADHNVQSAACGNFTWSHISYMHSLAV